MTIAAPPPPPPPPPPLQSAHDWSAIQDVAQAAFLAAAMVIMYLVFRYRRECSTKDQYAGATAAIGLTLCIRYGGHAEDVSDWMFVVFVGCVMIGLAYNSLRSDEVLRPRN